MKRFIFQLLAMVLLACNVHAATAWVSNHTVSPTGEDSLAFEFFNPDSLAKPLGGLDQTTIVVRGPAGDSIWGETISGVTGRIYKTYKGSGKYDTTYGWKALVADVDGTGRPGHYTVKISFTSNESGADLPFVVWHDFQLFPKRPSELFVDCPDSISIYGAMLQLMLDSTPTAQEYGDSLLSWLKQKNDDVFNQLVYDRFVAEIYNALHDNYEQTGSFGALFAYMHPDSNATITDLIDGILAIQPADTVANALLSKVLKYCADINSITIAIDQGMWNAGNYPGGWSQARRYNNVDSLFIGKIVTTSPLVIDTFMVKVYNHTGGHPGKPPDGPVQIEGWP